MKHINQARILAAVLLVSSVMVVTEVAAADHSQSVFVQGTKKPEVKEQPSRYQLDLELVNLFVLRNDADFDRTKPVYDEYGQSEGFLGTFLKPGFHVRHGKALHFYYETEIGTDLWSHSNPDHALGIESQTGLSMKQREIWGQAQFGKFAVKAGYQRTMDVTGLFLNYWIGALRMSYGCPWGSHVNLFVGQMPDQTFEGWQFGAEHMGSFKDDLMVTGLDGRWRFTDRIALDGGVYFMHDATVVRRTRSLTVGALQLNLDYPSWFAGVSLVGQFGQVEAGAADGGDTGIFGWGTAAKGGVHLGPVTIKGSLVALSADDAQEGNDSLGFLWSGKRPAQGILMNENPIRDIGGNVDELLGTFDGWFWEMRTGLVGGDIGVYYQPLSWLNVGAVSQALFVLNSDNALGSRFVGSENSLVVDLQFLDGRLNAILNGGVLLPGGAGAAYVNLIDRDATDVLVFSQAALVMRF